MNSDSLTEKNSILVVDDTPTNLQILTHILTKRGQYKVYTAMNGNMALTAASRVMPDLILLDIMMPGMDGYQVCEHLKADTRTKSIPVIFVSALSEVVDKVKSFKAGGVDFITKPFQAEEVLARVEAHLKVHNLQKQLALQNKRLQESENKYKNLFDSAADAILVYGLEHDTFIDANNVACDYLGYDLAEIQQLSLKDIEHEDDEQRLVHFIITLVEQQNNTDGFVEARCVRSDGDCFPAEISGRFIHYKDKSAILLIARDITERKQAEIRLRNANEKLQLTLDHLQATQNELVQSEKMASLGQLIAGVAHEIKTPLGAIRSSVCHISQFLSQNLSSLPDFFRQLSDAQHEEVMMLLAQTNNLEKPLSSREQRKIRRQLSKELDAHGIEDTMTVADKLVDMGIYEQIDHLIPLLKSDESSSMTFEILYQLTSLQRSSKTIETASERASKIILALKSFARYDHTGEKDTADIVHGLETVLTLYHNQLKHGVEVILNFEEVPHISCFPDELNQVWMNLIHNALQAMDYKGVLSVDITRHQEFIKISISDTGSGIPKEVQEKMFKPFFTTKPAGEGSGLGLDIVLKIVEKHQGKLELETEVGKGTTFHILLPIT
ncbi:response regulator [Candidatus Albibeggiatoa sp. nov. NOAA]|uniref:hybrid sensor histidine kinase/response regulator n=1 Tax=Candidatus Albibeggiatoa sp. nov. NOAA TaxID=3162724 RepID=UPI003304DF91|nr:response regulator [Thiotrichaceae bacterium]